MASSSIRIADQANIIGHCLFSAEIIAARIVDVYQRRSPWPQVCGQFGPLTRASFNARIRVAS